MEYFNITIENTGSQTFYFNLTVNGVQIAENQSIVNGTNETTDAVTGGSTFTLPGNQTINLTVMNESGSAMNANYTAYLAYVVLDSGFDYNEDISDSGGVSFFNVTIENLDTQTFYFNLTVNGYRVAENGSVANGTNGTIDAWAEGATFTLPGNQTINLTIMDIYGNETGAKYRSYLSYSAGILLFKLEPDNVTLEVCKSGQCSPYSNTTVRRLGETTAYLNFRIYDEDYGIYPNGTFGRVWVTEDHSNYTVTLNCTSENSGYCHVDYNATCSSDVGMQYCIGGTYDSCYEPANASVENLNVIGQLYARTIQPDENGVLNRNVSEILNVTIVDDCDNYISDTDVNWYNETPLLIANVSGSSFTYYNSTWYISENYVLGAETIYTNSTRTNYDMGSNTTHVYIYGWASIDNIDPENYTEYPAGSFVNITCHVIDINTGQPIQDYNVSYYKNESWQNFSLTDQYGNATWEWNTTEESAEWYDIKCNISDDTVKYYNTSVSYMNTLLKVRRQLIIDQINVSEPIVYRNDTYYPYETVISVHVNDASIGDANASNVTFWNTSMMIGYCITNESGNCNITWNPYNKSAADNHTIYINATKTGLENSTTKQTYIEIWGVLILNITSPINESNYTKTDNVTFDVNITNELGEDITDANVSWWNETSFLVTGDYYENFSLTGQSPGNRTITSNATNTYYLSGNDTVKILISGVADVLWDSPANYTEMPYPDPFNATCRVVDAISGIGIDEYRVEMYYYYTPPNFTFLANLTTNQSGHATYNFTPAQKGYVTFKCNITDNSSRLITAGISNAYGIVAINDTIPPIVKNVTIEPNQSIEANLNYTNITANVTDNVGVYGVWVAIGLPNGSYEYRNMANISSDLYRYQYWPHQHGMHNVTVHALDDPPEHNLNSSSTYYFDVWGKINGVVNQTIEQMVYGITQYQGFNFSIYINFTNLGPPKGYYINLSVLDD
ncbi:MAG: hypothetical protein JSW41_02800, partial [Candidatus Aenigmatarchaeota archaeon]